jgi:hypothetical protein
MSNNRTQVKPWVCNSLSKKLNKKKPQNFILRFKF